jgi:hypothetical protein
MDLCWTVSVTVLGGIVGGVLAFLLAAILCHVPRWARLIAWP